MSEKLDNLKLDRLKILLVGDPGTGKTSSIATLGALPFVKKMWIASFDGGIASAKATRKRLGIDAAKCDVEWDLYIEDDRTCPNAYKKFMKDFDAKVKADVDVIGLDGIGFLSKYCFWDIVALNQLVDKRYGDNSYHLYRMLMDKMSDVVTKAVKASKIVVGTCLPDWEKDENTGEIKVFPDVEGKATRQGLYGWFDEMYYTFCNKDKDGNQVFNLLTKPDGKYVAKTRWGGEVLKPLERRTLAELVSEIYKYYSVAPVAGS